MEVAHLQRELWHNIWSGLLDFQMKSVLGRTVIVPSNRFVECRQLGWRQAFLVLAAHGFDLQIVSRCTERLASGPTYDEVRDSSQQGVKQRGGILVGLEKLAIVLFGISRLRHGQHRLRKRARCSQNCIFGVAFEGGGRLRRCRRWWTDGSQ